MNQCALCMTEVHPEAIICVGCGAHKEDRMSFFPKMLFLGAFAYSLFACNKYWFWFGPVVSLMPIGVIVVALLYYRRYSKTYWVRKELK